MAVQIKIFKYLFLLFILSVLLFLLTVSFEEAEIPGWGFNVSRNLDDYIHYDKLTATIIPQDFCDKPSLLVIMVISSPSGFEARKVIRNTWGKEKSIMGHNVSLYFLVGQTIDPDVHKRVTDEYLEFNDVVQEDFQDTYNNLTIKSAMMLKLFATKCMNKSSYLLKIDDDIFLNLPRLVDELITRNQTENFLMGAVICGSKPIKDSSDKWYAGPSYLFSEEKYPDYTSGTSYCMSGDVADKLLHAALQTPVFHLEDVYLTGMCGRKIGLKPTNNGRFTYHRQPLDYCLYKILITIHYQSPEMIEKVYRALRDPQVEEQCQKQDKINIVHKWLAENVLMLNKGKRKKNCSK